MKKLEEIKAHKLVKNFEDLTVAPTKLFNIMKTDQKFQNAWTKKDQFTTM